MTKTYDFVVAGGSVAGLAFAAEASRRGASVVVAEEHQEIGEPEKCDGLVSLRGLTRYGYPPDPETVQNKISSAIIHSPSDRHFAVNATALDVVVLDRSAFDKQVAARAKANGAEVLTGTRMEGAVSQGSGVSAKLGKESVSARYLVDATGPASSPRQGIVPAAKFELEAPWVREHVVEVYLDAVRYPGFFAWVIPYGKHRAKVGAAGHGISPFKALGSFLEGKEHTVLRKVSAPIYIGGPAQRFVEGGRILVGESAGQVKPTTAGGIMTSIAGAVTAAKWACEALRKDDRSVLEGYQREWSAAFLKEMKAMQRLRGVFENLSNSDLEGVFSALATPRLITRLSQTDFDFHASALLGSLGMSGILRVAKVVASAEVRALLLEG